MVHASNYSASAKSRKALDAEQPRDKKAMTVRVIYIITSARHRGGNDFHSCFQLLFCIIGSHRIVAGYVLLVS